jgi:hypothetical protein
VFADISILTQYDQKAREKSNKKQGQKVTKSKNKK